MTDRVAARHKRRGKADRLLASQRLRDVEQPVIICPRTGKRIGRAIKGMVRDGIMFKCEACWGAHSFQADEYGLRITNVELRDDKPKIVSGGKLDAPADQTDRPSTEVGSIPTASTDA